MTPLLLTQIIAVIGMGFIIIKFIQMIYHRIQYSKIDVKLWYNGSNSQSMNTVDKTLKLLKSRNIRSSAINISNETFFTNQNSRKLIHFFVVCKNDGFRIWNQFFNTKSEMFLSNASHFSFFNIVKIDHAPHPETSMISSCIHQCMRKSFVKLLRPKDELNKNETSSLVLNTIDYAIWNNTETKFQHLVEMKKSNIYYNQKLSPVEDNSGEENFCGDSDIVDIEDLGRDTENLQENISERALKDMATGVIRKNLSKQGYKIVGSHSAVKICRWVKSMLRGKGGCYKHTFYGIASHRCMEATPNLSCANKCVFCWRHHTNPVGTSWIWKVDDPQSVLEGLTTNHYQMIKSLKGMSGVIQSHFIEAQRIAHCALSLVGEPIMYPKINEFLSLLHKRSISSFLVTNAQFPDAIRTLNPVTQLYISVDAPTQSRLKEVDRPLFPDFWERLLSSIQYLKEKKQRTVFRLTLINNYNMEDAEKYAKLIMHGNPGFVEVKGVTYSGNNESNIITMKSVPWYHQVYDFSKKICENLQNYQISCCHKETNSVLITHSKYFINGIWHTWIDFEKFLNLYARWIESNGEFTFTDMDYLTPTPKWALDRNLTS